MVAGVELLAQAIDCVIMRVQVSSAWDPGSLDPDPAFLTEYGSWWREFELLAQAIGSVIMRVPVSSASDPDSWDPDPAW